MPIYEFICEECQNRFETIMISISDRETLACSRCGSRRVRKTISVPCARVSSGGGSAIPSAPSAGGCSPRSGFS